MKTKIAIIGWRTCRSGSSGCGTKGRCEDILILERDEQLGGILTSVFTMDLDCIPLRKN